LRQSSSDFEKSGELQVHSPKSICFDTKRQPSRLISLESDQNDCARFGRGILNGVSRNRQIFVWALQERPEILWYLVRY
jgi:hypothetical protein